MENKQNNSEMKIRLEKQITNDMLVQLFEGSLYGGSNYWYMIKSKYREEKWYDKDGLCFSEKLAEALLADELNLEIVDIETEEFLGIINKENFLKGFLLCAEKYTDITNRFLYDIIDADDADVLLQFVVMGEVVYG